MKRTLVCVALAALLLGPCANARSATLSDQVASKNGWVAYRVAKIEGSGDPCCFSWHNDKITRNGCDLDGREWNFGSSDGPGGIAKSDSLSVYLHVEQGKLDKVRAMSASCPVTSKTEIRWIDNASAPESIGLLAQWVKGPGLKDDGEHALSALAYHADAGATRVLAEFAAPAHPHHLREQSLFWLGQARGVEGADVVERSAVGDADPQLRAHAVFALSQSHGGDTYAKIRAISHSDASDHVRGQALFWMAQMGDRRAAEDIVASVRDERSDEVREQAVFALSQLKGEQADAALIGLLQSNQPRVVKERALFWLGQSGSPRALEYFDRVLTSTAPRK